MSFGQRDPSDYGKGRRRPNRKSSFGHAGDATRGGGRTDRWLSVAQERRTYGPEGAADPFEIETASRLELWLGWIGRVLAAAWIYGKAYVIVGLLVVAMVIFSFSPTLNIGMYFFFFFFVPFILLPWFLLSPRSKGSRARQLLGKIILAFIVINIVAIILFFAVLGGM